MVYKAGGDMYVWFLMATPMLLLRFTRAIFIIELEKNETETRRTPDKGGFR